MDCSFPAGLANPPSGDDNRLHAGAVKNENQIGRKTLELKPPWWRRAWAECVGLSLILSLPLIFSAVAIASPRAPERLACGDDGNIELFTWHALHDVQLGSIRTHGNFAEHLGPIYFYLLAPLYGLFGCKHAGLQLGAIAINILAIGGVLGVARRCGGRTTMLWAALLVAGYVRFVGIPWLTSVWLPWVVILPFLATVFLCAAVISGRVYCLPAAVFVASFIVQTQVGYTAVLAAVVFLSLLSLVPRLRSWLRLDPRRLGSLPRAMSVTVVVLAIVWTPPAVKQILGMPGRISETVRYFAEQGVSHSWQEAEKTLGCAMAAFPASLVGVDLKRPRFADSLDGPAAHRALVLLLAIPQVVLLPLCCLLARRRLRDFDTAICLLAVALIPLCLFSLRRLAGGIVFHHVFWMTALGLLNVYVIGSAVIACLSNFVRFRQTTVGNALRGVPNARLAFPLWNATEGLPCSRGTRVASRAVSAVGTLAAIGLISLANVRAAARDLPIVQGKVFDWYMHDQDDTRIEGGDENDAKRFLALAAQRLQGHDIGRYRLRIIGLHRCGIATGMILGLTKQGLPPVLDPWYARVFSPQDAPPSRPTGGVFLLCNRRYGAQFHETPGVESIAESRYALLLWSRDDAVGEQFGSGDHP